MPDLFSTHEDVFLTEFSVAYSNDLTGYVADRIAKPIPVAKRKDDYIIYDRTDFLSSSGLNTVTGRPNSVRMPRTRSTEADWTMKKATFNADQYARNFPLDDALLKISDPPVMVEMATLKRLSETIKLDIERMISGMLCTRGNYGSGNKVQLANGSTSWAFSSSTPIQTDLVNGKVAVYTGLGRAANVLLVNYITGQVLSQNPDYLNLIRYVGKEGLTNSGLFPIIFGLETIEANPLYNSAADGATGVYSQVWQSDNNEDIAIVMYVSPGTPTLFDLTTAVQFDAPDDTLDTHNMVVARWREEWIQAERIEVRITRDAGAIATDGTSAGWNLGGLITGAYEIIGTSL